MSEAVQVFLDKVRTVLGPDAVVTDPEVLADYAEDYTEEPPHEPGCVVLPTSVEQVQAVVRAAAASGTSLTVRVSGSNVGGLALAPQGGVVVDLSRMNRILEVDPEDMYAVLEPGVTWQQLKDHLAAEELPLRLGYPLSPPDTSILANCLLDGLGNLSLRYGSLADWIGGLEVVLPTGDVVLVGAPALGGAWWGRGTTPALTDLFVNWQSATGIVTKLALQLWPMPPHRQRLFVLCYTRQSAFQAMRRLARMGICDDLGGLSWTTGRLLFGVAADLERAEGEPEFFLYVDLTGNTKEELDLKCRLLDETLRELETHGEAYEPAVGLATLVRLNPAFAKFAEFPTRLEFLVDHPGGGLTWVGTYGPMSRFEALADRAVEAMEQAGVPPTVVSRPMKGGHFGVLRFITLFDRKDQAEREKVRALNLRIAEAALDLGFGIYKAPAWVVPMLAERLDPGNRRLVSAIRRLLDPAGIMAPRSWAWEEEQ